MAYSLAHYLITKTMSTVFPPIVFWVALSSSSEKTLTRPELPLPTKENSLYEIYLNSQCGKRTRKVKNTPKRKQPIQLQRASAYIQTAPNPSLMLHHQCDLVSVKSHKVLPWIKVQFRNIMIWAIWGGKPELQTIEVKHKVIRDIGSIISK